MLPPVPAVVTVTSDDGRVDSFTSYVADLPCRTGSWVGVATTAGPEATVMPTGVDDADAPRVSHGALIGLVFLGVPVIVLCLSGAA